MSTRLTFIAKRESIEKLFPHLEGKNISTNGELAMFTSGAKLYKSPLSGAWTISGYDTSGDDVAKAMTEYIKIA